MREKTKRLKNELFNKVTIFLFISEIGDWYALKNFVNGCFERIWRSWIVWFLMKIKFANFLYYWIYGVCDQLKELGSHGCQMWLSFILYYQSIHIITKWLNRKLEEQTSSESKPYSFRNSICNLCLNKFLAKFNVLNLLFPYW